MNFGGKPRSWRFANTRMSCASMERSSRTVNSTSSLHTSLLVRRNIRGRSFLELGKHGTFLCIIWEKICVVAHGRALIRNIYLDGMCRSSFLFDVGSCLDIMKTAYPDGFDEVSIATILKQALQGL